MGGLRDYSGPTSRPLRGHEGVPPSRPEAQAARGRHTIAFLPSGKTLWLAPVAMPLKRRTDWRHESVEGRTGKRVRTGRERPAGCAASRWDCNWELRFSMELHNPKLRACAALPRLCPLHQYVRQNRVKHRQKDWPRARLPGIIRLRCAYCIVPFVPCPASERCFSPAN
jgi:hypothetical protein